jgi:hypothetical protein
MSQQIGIKSSPSGPFFYVENNIGNSLAFGSDNTNNMFVLNTSVNPDVLPGMATANINFDPSVNGNITFKPNGTGNSIFSTGSVTISAGNFNLPTTAAGFSAGVININNVRYFHAYNANGTTSPNLFVGPNAGNATLTTSDFNIGIGSAALELLDTGDLNIGIGAGAGGKITSGDNNILIGGYSLSSDLNTGNQNTFIGFQAGALITSGDLNICVGYLAGDTLTTTDNNNICIGNRGTSGDVGTIRLGTSGTHTAAYISGIYNNSPAGAEMVIVNTNGELGSQAVPSSFVWTVTTIDANAVASNGYIANKAGLLTMTLPATSAIGDIIKITGINTAVGWRIAQNANQQIFFGSSSTTVGVAGSITSTAIRDSLEIVCVVAGASSNWNVINAVGNLTVV